MYLKEVSGKMPKTLAYLLRKGVQDMSLTLREKQAVTRELSIRYMRSSKKEKSSAYSPANGDHRVYTLLCNQSPQKSHQNPNGRFAPAVSVGSCMAQRLSGR